MLKTVSSVGGTTGQLTYVGTWNANTNTPTLVSGTGTKNNYYVVSVAGTTTLDGISTWSVGDWAIFNGTVWEKVLGGTTESFANVAITTANGYLFANGTSNVTANPNIPVANVTGAVPNTVNVLSSGLLSGGGPLTGNVTISLANVPSGNVTGLGTMSTQNANAVSITGGTINGTIIGGSTPANITATNLAWTNEAPGLTVIVSAAGTTTLTSSSTYYQHITGSTTQTIKLPDQTTIPVGVAYIIDNDSTGNVTLQDSAGGALGVVTPGMAGYIYSMSNATATGNWGGYAFVAGAGPSGQVTWGTAGLAMGGGNLTAVNIANVTSATVTNLVSGNVTITGGSVNVTTTNHLATTTSTATYGTASLPLQPAGFMEVDLNGTVVKVPYYAV